MKRETNLGNWVSEKSRRKAALDELKELTKRAEKIKQSMSRRNSNEETYSQDVNDSIRRSRRRSNSLVTELLYIDQEGSNPDVTLSTASPMTRVQLLRMGSYGDILAQQRLTRRRSESPAPSKLLLSPDISRHPSNSSLENEQPEEEFGDNENTETIDQEEC